MSEATQRAVFLSYASQDGEAVRRIAEALRSAGVEVWFDLDELRGGDEWDRKIKNQIKSCALFVPVISGHTQARPEGYFRLEWHLAEQRSLLIARGRAFIVPVCIDETKEGEALVPDAFLAVQWSRPSSEARLTQFVAQVQRLLAQPQVSARSGASAGSARPAGKPETPVIPDYELLRQIGRGSYGEVWLARGATGLWRAVKIVWRERFANAEPFEREWRGLKEFAAISLGQSSRLALLHIGRNDQAGFFFYVMELADDAERGRAIDPAVYVPLTLAEVRRRRTRLPAAEVAGIGAELARQLAALHAHGLVHRDIKPSNVIFVEGAPKLADIGLVAPTSSAQTFVGTEGFVPPEGPGSPGADVYALGKVIYELAMGLDRQEFPQFSADLSERPDRRAVLALNDVILRACEPDVGKRYRDAAALLEDLGTLHAGKLVRHRTRGWPLWAAAAALAVLGAAGWFFARQPAKPAAVAAVTPAATNPKAESPGKSLIVLPLENLSTDPADAGFTEGMHEEIIQTLSRLGELTVLSRSTALSLKGTKEPLAAIGRRLEVTYALSGSLQRRGKNVRISLELRKAADEGIVWQKRFEQELIDGFALQDEIAAEVAKVLQIHTSTGWFAGAKFMTKNAEAFELFLRARDLPAVKGPSPATFREQAELGERVVALDPNFMAGASMLSQAYSYLYTSALGSADAAARAEIAAKAKRWAEHAAALMPGGAGDGALCVYYSRVERDGERAFRYAQNEARALPNDPNAHNRMGASLCSHGRYREGLASYNRALALDSFHARTLYNRVRCAAYLRDLPAFEDAAAKSLAFGGQNVDAGEIDILRFRLTGRLPDSLDHLAKAKIPYVMAQSQLLWLGRRYEEVLDFTGSPASRTPNLSARQAALGLRARAADRLGRPDVKAEAARAMLEIAEKTAVAGGMAEPDRQRLRVWALVLSDRKDEALTTTRWLIERLTAPSQVGARREAELELAGIYAWFGDARECVDLLERLIKVPCGVCVPDLKLAPDWDRVRDDARFQALLADPRNAAPL